MDREVDEHVVVHRDEQSRLVLDQAAEQVGDAVGAPPDLQGLAVAAPARHLPHEHEVQGGPDLGSGVVRSAGDSDAGKVAMAPADLVEQRAGDALAAGVRRGARLHQTDPAPCDVEHDVAGQLALLIDGADDMAGGRALREDARRQEAQRVPVPVGKLRHRVQEAAVRRDRHDRYPWLFGHSQVLVLREPGLGTSPRTPGRRRDVASNGTGRPTQSRRSPVASGT